MRAALHIHRESWCAACCRCAAFRRHAWRPLDKAWEEVSAASDNESTKSGADEAPAADVLGAAADFDGPEATTTEWEDGLETHERCATAHSRGPTETEEFFSDAYSERAVGSGYIEEQPLAARSPPRPNFAGQWTCIDTFGLQDFLKQERVSKLQRMAAARSAWPSWEFEQQGDSIKFVSRAALGNLVEEFTVDGPEYATTDLWRQKIVSRASWSFSTLVTERETPQGRYREERYIDDNGFLQFRFRKQVGHEWGRTFKRVSMG